MDRPERLSSFQVDLATTFFGLDSARGYVVAGGAALLASHLIDRTTEDLDLFTAPPATSVTAARDDLVRVLRQQGCDIVIIHDARTFCRLVVERAGDQTLVNLAIDSPPHAPPTLTVLGPTLAPVELAGRKLLALFGRAEARDFADVYLLAQRFGTDVLVEQAHALDPGFDRAVLAQMIRTIDRFDDEEIPLGVGQLSAMRAFFSDWAAQLG